ncbi:MAG TPA: hypothetical protein VFD90_03010 [Gaiellales bacterium]|jgi:hypothetical protein|nr:hypothetical protein [Gaiellales bacterium]
MGKVVVRYKVKPERVEENERLVERVYAELAESAPAGLRYATFRLDDGVSFVHIASIDTEDGSNPLRGIQAFAEFGRDIAERCDEPPVAQDSQLVGSYGFFT